MTAFDSPQAMCSPNLGNGCMLWGRAYGAQVNVLALPPSFKYASLTAYAGIPRVGGTFNCSHRRRSTEIEFKEVGTVTFPPGYTRI